MSGKKFYEEGDFRFEFTPNGSPLTGTLTTSYPDLHPFTSEISLTKGNSRASYAKEAAELFGLDDKLLKKSLNVLCSTRMEEVEAAKEAEQTSESPGGDEAEEVNPAEIEALLEGRVLDKFARDVSSFFGIIKEEYSLRLLALVALGAQLDLLPGGKTIAPNCILTAESGRGKNYICDGITGLLPDDFYFAFESSSSKALHYKAQDNPDLFKHRWMYPNEAEGTDYLVETFRPLLSSGRSKHITVNKDSSGANTGQEMSLNGPVTLTIPTIRNKLDTQLQTRMLVVELSDYEGRVADHSKAVSDLLSADYTAEDHSHETLVWRQALRSLTGIRRVVTPLEHEKFHYASETVSHGARLWTNVLGLMSAHAWLHQRNRDVSESSNGELAVVAKAEDYRVAFTLFKETCGRSVINLSKRHREILDALYELQEVARESDEDDYEYKGFVQREISKHAGIPQSSISDNKTFLMTSAKLIYEPHGGGLALVKGAEPSWWENGNVMDGFPDPDQVEEWWENPSDPSTSSKPANQGDQSDHEDLTTQTNRDNRSDRNIGLIYTPAFKEQLALKRAKALQTVREVLPDSSDWPPNNPSDGDELWRIATELSWTTDLCDTDYSIKSIHRALTCVTEEDFGVTPSKGGTTSR